MNPQDEITRIRILYTKEESLRFTGHLDMQRLWERLLRRSALPVRYSRGYHPRARINLASALPLGFISEAELMDFWLDELLTIDEVRDRLIQATPPGLKIKAVQQVPLPEDALQVQLAASEFEVTFFDLQDIKELTEKVGDLLAKEKTMRKRRKKVYDLRPLILEMTIIESDQGGPALWMRLRAQQGATGRPDEVLDQMGFDNTEYLVCRTKLILMD